MADENNVTDAEEVATETSDLETMPPGMYETIRVTYPIQRFVPAPYCTMGVGDVAYTTFIRPGETFDEAFDRAFNALQNQVRNTFAKLQMDFETRHRLIESRKPQ